MGLGEQLQQLRQQQNHHFSPTSINTVHGAIQFVKASGVGVYGQVPWNLKCEESVSRAVVSIDGMMLESIPRRHRGIVDVVVAAVNSKPMSLCFASKMLRGNRVVVAAAVSKNGLALEYASDGLKNNRDVGIIAVSNDGNALQFLSTELRSNREIVMCAIATSMEALSYVDKSLIRCPIVWMAAVKRWGGRALCVAPDSVRGDKEFMLKTLCFFPKSYKYLVPEVWNDMCFVARAIRLSPGIVSYKMSHETLMRWDVIRAVVKGTDPWRWMNQPPGSFYWTIQHGACQGVVDVLINAIREMGLFGVSALDLRAPELSKGFTMQAVLYVREILMKSVMAMRGVVRFLVHTVGGISCDNVLQHLFNGSATKGYHVLDAPFAGKVDSIMYFS